MSKLRSIIRLNEGLRGRKIIAEMARTSRNMIKKYISRRNTLAMSYDEFQRKSDAELNELFCISDSPVSPGPRMDALLALMPRLCKELDKKGMASQKQWEWSKSQYPDGYALTQFLLAIQRYQMISNPSMRMEHKAGDKMFVDYTGTKLWVYPPGEPTPNRMRSHACMKISRGAKEEAKAI